MGVPHHLKCLVLPSPPSSCSLLVQPFMPNPTCVPLLHVRSNAHHLPHSSDSWDAPPPSSSLASEPPTEPPSLVMTSIIPVVMAGVLGIYGLIVAVLLASGIKADD